jgi:ubiquinone/menaquinone biosynthesis C-methylase UbiE
VLRFGRVAVLLGTLAAGRPPVDRPRLAVASRPMPESLDAVAVNRIFHDHECRYYDTRFAIVHDARSARQARREVERLLGRRIDRRWVVLDAGCGTGYLAGGLRRAVPGLRVVGVDLSEGMLGRARVAGAWPLAQADGLRLPVASGAVDLVVARGVLHHVPAVSAALAEWRRVLRPGGAVVLLSEPTPAVQRHGERLVRGLLAVVRRPLAPEDDFWEVASMAANLHVFTPEQLAGHARAAGFADVRLSTADFAETMLLTASYVLHGRAPRLSAALPWRAGSVLAGAFDAAVVNRVLPIALRHTVVGVLRR